MGREHLAAGALVHPVEQHQLQYLGQRNEVDAHAGGLAGTAWDHVLLAVQGQRHPGARGGFQAAADGYGAGFLQRHSLRAVVLHQEFDGHAVVHEGRVAGACLDALHGLEQEGFW